MIIKRNIVKELIDWKNKPERKPLILQGIRQVGKTWILNYFGRNYFEDVAYFNFDKQKELSQFFSTTLDPARIIDNLSLVHGRRIQPGNTLIIFDEIQECNNALNSLKYFCEEQPDYFIACAGSLLGVALARGASFPVGKVDFLKMYPVTFSEYLAEASPDLSDYLSQIEKVEPLPDIFFNRLNEKLKMYFISGGMPEAAGTLLDKMDIKLTQEILQNNINAYLLDFSKHVENKDILKINYIWNSLPSQLARENKKFLYQSVRPGARAREYEDALFWLEEAGLIYRIFNVSKPGVPLSAYQDLSAFKVYALDCGLLRRLARLSPEAILSGNAGYIEFKGALAENAILQALVPQSDGLPNYWNSGNRAEVDFLLQEGTNIVPVEVKAEKRVSGKSLSVYSSKFEPKLKIRFSMNNLKKDNGLLSLPSCLADWTFRFIRQELHDS